MSFRQYCGYRAVPLCFWGIGAVLLAVFLLVAEARPFLIWLAEGLLLLLAAAWLLIGFFLDRARLRRLEKLMDDLPDKYLLGELLPVPVNLLEQQYFRIMKVVSRSAIGAAEQALRDKEDYCRYVESWIHEIKTPLTACSLILANGGDSRKLRRELKRADNLTECILYYARLRTAEKDTLIREVSAAALMDEAVKDQMDLLIGANIGVDVTGDFSVLTDGKAIRFMLGQLLVNCAKYCPGCHVTLTASEGAITVEDDGIGIPSQDLRRVTQRGFTGANGRRLGGSTGMGLYIVAQMCSRLGIDLTITSSQGEGTRVSLSFAALQNCKAEERPR